MSGIAPTCFPALAQRPGLLYLDSAATCLLHHEVFDAMHHAMRIGGTAGRGSHQAGFEATECVRTGRIRIAQQIGAPPSSIVFVRSATEGLNLLARGWAPHLLPSDRLLVTVLEHHSNVLPWRALARDTGARIDTVGCDERGDLDLDDFERLLVNQPKVLALTHVSNVTGAALPVIDLMARYRAVVPDGLVVIDGSQAIAHLPIDVTTLGADFYVFSGHKAYGPLGVGVVWGAPGRLEALDPWLWGGGMVSDVSDHGHVLADIPWRFEGGTPNHVAIAGLAAGIGFCGRSDETLATRTAQRLASIEGVTVLGDPKKRVGIVSWTHDGRHPHDIGTALDAEGIAVRTGHGCAQPYLTALGQSAMVRASFGAHNTPHDVDRLIRAVTHIQTTNRATP